MTVRTDLIALRDAGPGAEWRIPFQTDTSYIYSIARSLSMPVSTKIVGNEVVITLRKPLLGIL